MAGFEAGSWAWETAGSPALPSPGAMEVFQCLAGSGVCLLARWRETPVPISPEEEDHSGSLSGSDDAEQRLENQLHPAGRATEPMTVPAVACSLHVLGPLSYLLARNVLQDTSSAGEQHVVVLNFQEPRPRGHRWLWTGLGN